jgi:hypothetical protein
MIGAQLTRYKGAILHPDPIKNPFVYGRANPSPLCV